MDIFTDDLKLGHKRIMENFTPGSLKKFINQGPSPSQGHPQGQARSARGQRVSDALQNAARQKQGPPDANGNLDALIRQSMGELVRKYMQAGKLQELKIVMEEHRSFIDEILGLLSNSTKK